MTTSTATSRPPVLVSSSTLGPRGLLEKRPDGASPPVSTCTERLPRDVLVRLVALSRQVGDIREDHGADAELASRLNGVAADLDDLIQRIYDETVRHLAGRRR